MATTKQRIQVTVSSDAGRAIKILARRDRVPRATKAAQLIDDALELQEDIALSQIADERLRNYRGPWLTHEEVWGKKSGTSRTTRK